MNGHRNTASGRYSRGWCAACMAVAAAWCATEASAQRWGRQGAEPSGRWSGWGAPVQSPATVGSTVVPENGTGSPVQARTGTGSLPATTPFSGFNPAASGISGRTGASAAETVSRQGVFVPAAPSGGPSATERALSVVEGAANLDCFQIENSQVGMFADIYQQISPYFRSDEYAAIMKRVDASIAARAVNGTVSSTLWVPHRTSTMVGSLQRVADVWDSVEDARNLTRIAVVLGRGFLEEKETGEIIDDLVATGVGMSSAGGEAAYWAMAIGTGMYNGRSFSEAVTDAFDPETAGVWSKTGWGLGYWCMQGVARLEQLMDRNERRRVDEAMLAHLRAAGYGDEAEAALRAWLALDLEERVLHPFALTEEWKTAATEKRRQEAEEKAAVEAGNAQCPVEEKPKGRPCTSCMFGDLYGTCSTPTCPNYGHPHRDYNP